MEIEDIIALGRPKKNTTKVNKEKIYTKRKVDEIVFNIDFDNIYENFNIDKPLNNEDITEKYLKGYNGNIFNHYIDFCNFLIKKINNAKSKNEIKKIPLIISNISGYRGTPKNGKNKIIKEKRSEVMYLFKNKIFK